MKKLLCCLLMLVAWNVVAKECPRCGAKMIKTDSGICLTSNPPQYPWYWYCGCGNTEEGGIRMGTTAEGMRQARWEMENDPYRQFIGCEIDVEAINSRLAELERKVEWILKRQGNYCIVDGTTTTVFSYYSASIKRYAGIYKTWKELYEEQKGGKK